MANVSSFTGAMPVIPGGTVEVAYVPITTDVTISATSETSPTTIISDTTVVCDGGPYLIEFVASFAQQGGGAGNYNVFNLWIDGAKDKRIANQYTANSIGDIQTPIHGSIRVTPSAGSHTFGVRAWRNSANGYVAATAADNKAPAFMRISKIVNQNDGLKPFWTPPVVTQLPSQATVGDQVIYAADATNGVYWHLQYDGLGTYPWKFIGGAALRSVVETWEGTTTNYPTYTSLATAGPQLTPPLEGQYATEVGYISQETNGGYHTTGVTQTTGATVNVASLSFQVDATSSNIMTSGRTRVLTLVTTAPIRMMYARNGTGTANFGNRSLSLTPVRVKAA